MNERRNALLAGLVIVAGVAIGAYFFLSSSKSSLNAGNSQPYYALLTDASGVNAKSLITVAGLQVGEIQRISLVSIALKELVPDFDARVASLLDPQNPDSNVRHSNAVERIDEFDQLLRRLLEETSVRAAADAAPLKEQVVRVARVDMRVSNDVVIPEDTWVRKESLGVLGAKALFLDLGRSKTRLPANSRILRVRSLTGTDALLAQAEGIVADVRNITKKLDTDIGGITHDIKGITGELNRFVNGDGDTMPLDELYRMVMTDLRKLTRTLDVVLAEAGTVMKENGQQFSLLVGNVQRITKDLADLTSATGGSAGADGGVPEMGDLRATMASVRKISDDLSEVTTQLKSALGSDDGDGVKKLQETITELNRTLASLSEVAGRVERGEGTVGRLLTDEGIADKVESAVSGAADFVTSLTSLETHIDIGSWYAVNRSLTTTTIGLKLQPRPDKFYLIEIVDDGGFLERLVRTQQSGDETRESIREEDNQLRFTAMFAKRFFDLLVLRAGLVESTGGVGANLFLFDNRLELRSDLFGTRGPRDSLVSDVTPFYLPRWRTLLKAQPIEHLYISAGIDDVLNAWSWERDRMRLYNAGEGFGFDYFVGVGLTFQDDDLRAILPFIPGA